MSCFFINTETQHYCSLWLQVTASWPWEQNIDNRWQISWSACANRFHIQLWWSTFDCTSLDEGGSTICMQEYIENGYKELTMPATRDGESAMEPNFLHIRPHHKNHDDCSPKPWQVLQSYLIHAIHTGCCPILWTRNESQLWRLPYL